MGQALIGGALIGLAATLFWAANGRIAGVSGILRGALRDGRGRGESVAFLVGLVVAGFASATSSNPAATHQPLTVLLGGGLLVGFGTRLGGGCTSGHGVCGISRFSVRSIVATATFVATGAATVFLAARLAPAVLAR